MIKNDYLAKPKIIAKNWLKTRIIIITTNLTWALGSYKVLDQELEM